MQTADEACNEVDTTTIRNGQSNANTLPGTDSSISSSLAQPSLPISSPMHTTDSCDSTDPIQLVQAENAVREALDKLEAIGALQASNRMDLEEFLNPAAERENLFDETDEDIYQAVMDSKAAREANEVDSESDEPVEPCPTRREALQAVLLLEKYIVHFNDPFMFELGSMLRSFGQRTRFLESQAMKDTKITSYFPPK